MRPNRNRISRLVAAEMRYFHRPLILALLSCFTVIIVILSVLFSLLNYVSNTSLLTERLYLNFSIALLIMYVASYVVYRILRWRRSLSYQLTMAFTSVNFLFSAAASFLLIYAAWQAPLNSAAVNGYALFIDNLLRWVFWAPGAVALLYFVRVFIKAKTANRDGGWWFLAFPLLPVLIVGLLATMPLTSVWELKEEKLVFIASILIAPYLSLMLTLAVQYTIKAVLFGMLRRMQKTEDTVLVRTKLRTGDGKWIQWWEKPPVSIELIDNVSSSEPETPDLIPKSETIAPEPQPETAAEEKFLPAAALELEPAPDTETAVDTEQNARRKTHAPRPSVRPRIGALAAMALAAIRRPMAPVSATPPSISEETIDAVPPVLAESEKPGKSAPDAVADVIFKPETGLVRLFSKLKYSIARAVNYLKKPYSPPIDAGADPVSPCDRSKSKNKSKQDQLNRERQLTRLASTLEAVVRQRQMSIDGVADPEKKAAKNSKRKNSRSKK